MANISKRFIVCFFSRTTDPLPDTEHSSWIILLFDSLQPLVIFYAPEGFFPIRFKCICFVVVCTRIRGQFSDWSNVLSYLSPTRFIIDLVFIIINAIRREEEHCFAPSWSDGSFCTIWISFLYSFASNEHKECVI